MAGLNPTPEVALHFGERQRLVGVLSLPPPGIEPRMPVVIPSTGLDPRPGPNRLHVHLARHLAACGHPVLRMDLGGLGDSDLSPGQSADALKDLRDALDALGSRRHGPAFALIGDCSGAHDAYRFALTDTRVHALVLIDGYAYDTPRHVRNRLVAKLRRAPQRISEWMKYGLAGPDMPASGVGYYATPSRAEAEQGYAALQARGVRMAFAFTGDVAREYSYAEQHEDSFPTLRGAVTVWHLNDADHTFTRRAARASLATRLSDWLAPT